MKVLAIDTTTKIASVAIGNENTYIKNEMPNEITHSEKLLPLIDHTLEEFKLTLKDIDVYACINGPGSFTGIRIGLATLKAFALVYDKPIFSISSMDLLAYKASKQYGASLLEETGVYVVSLIDARNARVYYKVTKVTWNLDHQWILTTILDTKNDPIDTAIATCLDLLSPQQDSPTIYIGDCMDQHELLIQSMTTEKKCSPYAICSNYPTTVDLLMARTELAQKESYLFNTDTLDAIYARPSQAERMKQDEK